MVLRIKMAESILISSEKSDKISVYDELIRQLTSLLEGEKEEIICMANTVAGIKEVFEFLWVGFYRVAEEELLLGPFQGPVACNRIGFGKGVCGKAWELGETILVPDVNEFPGHISCNASSRSEIVVPLKNASGKVFAVLDIDSDQIDAFDSTDQRALERLADYLAEKIYE